MTDQSRVEAVVAAATKKVVALKCGEAFCFITDEQWDEIIQAAIEANDAWLKARGWKAVPREPDRSMLDAGWDYWEDCGQAWELMYEASPSRPSEWVDPEYRSNNPALSEEPNQ